MLLTLVRNGHATNQATGHVSGHYDWSLSEEGHLQAQQLAKALANTSFDHMYASDLLRTKQTAEYIIAHLPNTPFAYDTRLRERTFGPYDGMEKQELAHKLNLSMHQLYAHIAGLPTSERAHEFYHRARNYVQRLQEHHADDHVLCITHDGMQRALSVLLQEQPISDIDTSAVQFANASITTFDITPTQMKIITWNNTEHLISH